MEDVMGHALLLASCLNGKMKAEDVRIEGLDLSVRTANALTHRDPPIHTLGDLIKTPAKVLLKRLPFGRSSLGKKGLKEIQGLLREFGLGELSTADVRTPSPPKCSVAGHKQIEKSNDALRREVRSLRQTRKRVALKLHREYNLTQQQIGDLFGRSSSLIGAWIEAADRAQRRASRDG